MIHETVWLYGYQVARREKLAHSDYQRFQSVNELCLELWEILKDAGCYQDQEASELKSEYRPYYYDGLNNIPYHKNMGDILNLKNWQEY